MKLRKLLFGLLLIFAVSEAKGQSYVTYYKKGESLSQSKNWPEAIEYLKAALQGSGVDKKSIATRNGVAAYFPNRELGIIYFMQGKKEEAKQLLEKSYRDEPTDRALEFLQKLDPSWMSNHQLATIPQPKPLFEKEKLEKSAESVEGGGSLTFKIPVRNEGEGRFDNGKIRIAAATPVKGVEFEPLVAVGDVRGGGSRLVQITIRTNQLLTDGKAALTLSLESESGTVWDELPISFSTLSPPTPLIKLVGLFAGNDAKLVLEKGRRVKAVKLLLKNEGRGTLVKPRITLTLNEQPISPIINGLTTILAGETATIPCEFFIPSSFVAAAATVGVTVQEGSGTYTFSEKIAVPVQEPVTPLVHFDKTMTQWEGTREGFITRLSQPTLKYAVVNESDEPSKDLIVKVVQAPTNVGLLVPASKKVAPLESNKTVGDEAKLSVSPKLLKGTLAKFTLRLENPQGKLLDKMDVEVPVLVPTKPKVSIPSAEESHNLIVKIGEFLENNFYFNLRSMGSADEDIETKSNFQKELVRLCFKKGDKVSIGNDIVPSELILAGKFPEAYEAESYLNNLFLWYDSYQVDFQSDDARFSPILFSEKGIPYVDVYVSKTFTGKSKSKDFLGVTVTQENLLQIKIVFDRYRQSNGKWDSRQLSVKGVEKVKIPTTIAVFPTAEEWEKKEANEKNELMSLSSTLNGLVENLKSKLPPTTKRLVAEHFMKKDGKSEEIYTYKIENELTASLALKKIKWINAEEWDPLKAVPNEEFLMEGTYELGTAGLKLKINVRNFRTYESVGEAEAIINPELLGIATK
ncbi:tetratricopeptide repeat protein [Runella salmonicolor]|uniref:Tetratricopeptide repeat protein n=1 Tax=Runella salmonicolor TaxID=2950278 RepID=A0ABT1FUZ4_9BACT|nr:tetratricopeptide repeat protein [Runella salmonicolor]MCP1385581.1 tetratricopeptide repeat protein [Runella salmonicolor]